MNTYNTHISNSSEHIETLYSLPQATEIVMDRAAMEAKRIFGTTLKTFLKSPKFIKKIIGIMLIVGSIYLSGYCRKHFPGEPVYGFYIILLVGIYLVFENDECDPE